MRGAPPGAGGATRASGRGRCATQVHRRQGAHRVPQQFKQYPAAGGRCRGIALCAAVEKFEDQRKPEEFFGHRKRSDG